MRDLKNVLLVEPDPIHRDWVKTALTRLGCTVHCATGVDHAVAVLATEAIDLIVSEQLLHGGNARGILEAAVELTPIPLMITMSQLATREDVFQMARAGVAAYLEKPFTVEQLTDTLRQARHYRLELPMVAASLVGAQPVGELANELREAMTRQAMALANGNTAMAARFLGVHRQALAKMWKRVAPAAARRRKHVELEPALS